MINMSIFFSWIDKFKFIKFFISFINFLALFILFLFKAFNLLSITIPAPHCISLIVNHKAILLLDLNQDFPLRNPIIFSLNLKLQCPLCLRPGTFLANLFFLNVYNSAFSKCSHIFLCVKRKTGKIAYTSNFLTSDLSSDSLCTILYYLNIFFPTKLIILLKSTA